MHSHKPAPPASGPPLAARLRRWIIEQSLESNVGHIGSALSVAEIMAVLWGRVMRDPGTADPQRDRFILAKGHAALALYGVLRDRGLLSAEQFRTYCKDGSLLGAHPEWGLPGVDTATGSLGQGLSVGCGMAHALKQLGSAARVFVLLSDAECNEGQVWEAAMFAAHHRLDNLIAVVDLNGVQAMGATETVLDLSPLARRWEAFGWDAVEVDGHDEDELLAGFTTALAARRGPGVVIARTALGKGVPFMEGRLEWHYRNLTPELARDALRGMEV
jgi:transketolase